MHPAYVHTPVLNGTFQSIHQFKGKFSAARNMRKADALN